MSQLTELIEKTIKDIQFNGCQLSESIIRMQIDNIVACAKLEEAIERNQKIGESLQLDSAHGNGANDRPNVIGDMITEPSLTPEQMVKGEWYVLDDQYNTFLTRFHYKTNVSIFDYKTYSYHTGNFYNVSGALCPIDKIKSIRPATKEEVLKYFPDEPFGEPEQVGRWYKFISLDSYLNWDYGKWYFCPKNNPNDFKAFIDNNGDEYGFYPKNDRYFDLTNPQLNNPDLEYVNPITN